MKYIMLNNTAYNNNYKLFFHREYQSRDGESQAWFDERTPNNLKLQSNDFSPMGHAIDIEPYQSPDYNLSSRGPINNGNYN